MVNTMQRTHAASPEVAVSVVICTYNRCDMLEEALVSLLQQEHPPPHEIVVVDNNSTDGTKAVAERVIARSGGRMRYVFEGQQGLSHARNAGVRTARGSVVAFTDDDVRVRPDWVAKVWAAFQRWSWVDYVGGKVLPRWPRPPPAWLTERHWGPLALLDYGPSIRQVDADWAVCMVGANFAVRRTVFERVGLFHPAYQHRRGSSSAVEDHEWQYRTIAAGGVGAYVPDVGIEAAVQPNRLDRAYHRKWHVDHGRAVAPMRELEAVLRERRGVSGRSRFSWWTFRVPPYLLATIVSLGARWLAQALRMRREPAFLVECELREAIGYARGLLDREPLPGPAPRLEAGSGAESGSEARHRAIA
jgi:glycosyltransferase involved in cell wall biosynthesis